MTCGLLGKTLGHSYSPMIHSMLGIPDYLLFEKPEDELPNFLRNGDWTGLNVTIPYKKTVMQWVDVLSETARACGCVNALVRTDDGKIYGDNTDVQGFTDMISMAGYDPRMKKGLILGSGGASAAVGTALHAMGAKTVVISRTGENNYRNLELHSDADFIINATPVGMNPLCNISPVDLSLFPTCRFAGDVIYNPARTEFLMQAQELGIPSENGLYMLISQARRSAELFLGRSVETTETQRIFHLLKYSMQNLVLCSSSSDLCVRTARVVGNITGRPYSGKIPSGKKEIAAAALLSGSIITVTDTDARQYARQLQRNGLFFCVDPYESNNAEYHASKIVNFLSSMEASK